MKLKTWLEAERGRGAALAKHLRKSPGRITQMADNGVPVKYMRAVAEFTGGEVPVDEMVEARTPEQRAA